MFETIEPKRGHGASGIKGIKVSRDASGRINLAFGRDVCKRIGFAAGDRVNILWGSGTDAGRMRVELSPKGQNVLFSQRGNKTLRVCTNIQPAWMEKTKVPSTKAPIAQEAIRSITFDLPLAMFSSKSLSAVA